MCERQGRSHHCIVDATYHISALPMPQYSNSSPSWGRLQGSRLHDRPSASSYTSAVIESSPPATRTHPPMAAHATYLRASCIGGSGSHRSMSPSRVSTSQDAVSACLLSPPPKTAKRPSLSTHPLPRWRPTLTSGKYLHCQLGRDPNNSERFKIRLEDGKEISVRSQNYETVQRPKLLVEEF
jgi:hypothetical protein